jgi:predicted tellurium resistance membrane protein TerC
MRATAPLFTVLSQEISWRDLILITGGMFLIWKATHEIHGKLEGERAETGSARAVTFGGVLVQILILDIVFSLDSIITAVGMAKQVPVMVTAIVIAVIVMMVSSGAISRFIDRHPTVKMLALSFLLLIGVALVGEGLDQHIPKGYLYFAMAFSVFVELLNLRTKTRGGVPVKLRRPRLERALDGSEGKG